jgi:hypothetical protein
MSFSQPPRVSRRTAQRNLVRGTKFLGTLSRVSDVRALLEQGAGYSEQDHELGWSLLLTALGYIRKGMAAPAGAAVTQQAALIELDEWDGVNFERTRATLKFTFPEQHDYVFQGLTAATGVDAIGTVQTFVERVAALRDGTDPERESTREADAAAAARLAERKIFDPQIQAHLESLLTQAKRLAPLPIVAPTAEELQNAADELHVWLSDWMGQARVFVRRGDYQLRLGLSAPRGRGEVNEEEDEEEEEAVPATEAAGAASATTSAS